uniref:Uncharacterized protein n=1 Tax=Rhizophora mucronata TaxID=61149 RepID=A0A2P2QP23_RHIMU
MVIDHIYSECISLICFHLAVLISQSIVLVRIKPHALVSLAASWRQ